MNEKNKMAEASGNDSATTQKTTSNYALKDSNLRAENQAKKPFYDKEAVFRNLNIKNYYESETGLSLGSIGADGWTKKNFLCVFHNEKTGSLGFNVNNGAYKCHGCGAQGDVFKFQMERHSQTFEDAIKTLAERTGTLPDTQYQDTSFRHPQLGFPDLKYNYTDVNGKILFHNCRFQNKEFRPCNPMGQWNIKGIKRVPYNQYLRQK